MSEEFNRWEEAGDLFEKAVDQTARKTAFDIQAGYQARAKVDTGFMKNSAYVVTSKDSSYGLIRSPTKPGAYLLPEEKPTDAHEAVIGVGADYALVMELGSVHMPPHPAMIPAVEAARGPFETALGLIESKIHEVLQ